MGQRNSRLAAYQRVEEDQKEPTLPAMTQEDLNTYIQMLEHKATAEEILAFLNQFGDKSVTDRNGDNIAH